MMITVKAITTANISDPTPYLRASAVARATTTEVCTDGIPPLHRARARFHFPDCFFTISPLIHTAAINDIAGTKIMVS